MGFITLDKLIRALGSREVALPLPVLDITNDSRQVKPGSLFIAVPGFRTDGHQFIPAAVKAGAMAIVAQRRLPGLPVPQFIVKDTRRFQGRLAAEFYSHPSRQLKLCGITGTNGKTTCTFMLEAIFQAAGLSTGLLGTLYNKVKDIIFPTANTSPDSILCQRLLREMVDVGVSHASMEVSSHATVLHRIAGINFSLGAITNFSPDHLDLHQSMAQYAQAKAAFFRQLSPKGYAIINQDDPGCLRIAAATPARPLYYSLTNPGADVTLAGFQARRPGGIARVKINPTRFPGQPHEFPFSLALPGRHNLANALLVATAALALGIDATAVTRGLSNYRGIFRRYEVIYDGRYRVIDDAAHNPANLEAVFQAVIAEEPAEPAIVYAIRGSRGSRINRANAATLAYWAEKLNPRPLVITNCTDTAAPQDAVQPEEEEAFRAVFSGLATEVYFTDTLRQALSLALGSMTSGRTLLLLGAHPMDEVAPLFARLAGVETTVHPRPPRFGLENPIDNH